MTLATRIAAVSIAAAAVASCSSEKPAPPAASSVSAPAAPAAAPDGLFAESAPADAVAIAALRASAKAGDNVVLTGFVGGRTDPFTKGRAMFVVADGEQTPPCTDHCETPWDACCEPKDKIAASTATVQVVGADGALLKTDLNGTRGLKPGATVTVAGVVKQADDAVFVVDAKTIHVAQ